MFVCGINAELSCHLNNSHERSIRFSSCLPFVLISFHELLLLHKMLKNCHLFIWCICVRIVEQWKQSSHSHRNRGKVQTCCAPLVEDCKPLCKINFLWDLPFFYIPQKRSHIMFWLRFFIGDSTLSSFRWWQWWQCTRICDIGFPPLVFFAFRISTAIGNVQLSGGVAWHFSGRLWYSEANIFVRIRKQWSFISRMPDFWMLIVCNNLKTT